MAEAVGVDEPGCLVFRASRSLEDPEVFVLYEEYVDEAACWRIERRRTSNG